MTNKKQRYECARCGNCCRWPGPVRVNEQEIEELAKYLKISKNTFMDLFTRLIDNGKALSLTEKLDGSCSLLSGKNDCLVHEVKPRQCRTFPNEWNFEGFRELCKAKLIEL